MLVISSTLSFPKGRTIAFGLPGRFLSFPTDRIIANFLFGRFLSFPKGRTTAKSLFGRCLSFPKGGAIAIFSFDGFLSFPKGRTIANFLFGHFPVSRRAGLSLFFCLVRSLPFPPIGGANFCLILFLSFTERTASSNYSSELSLSFHIFHIAKYLVTVWSFSLLSLLAGLMFEFSFELSPEYPSGRVA